MKSVYSAVRTGSLNKAVCASSLTIYRLRDAPPVNIQQLYALPTLYLCVLYLSENKQRLVPFGNTRLFVNVLFFFLILYIHSLDKVYLF